MFTLRDYDQPGPYAVSAVEWNAGAVEVEAAVTLSGTLSLPLFGVTYYPSLDTGEGQPIAPGGPFPLVVWGHARFQRIDAPNRNHHQTDYLLRHLASWGYIATSVNLDALGIYNNPPAISERAAMLVATITYHLGPTAGAGLLIDGADSRRIALGGLSRGAEAAALAAQVGRYPVRALTLVAPTDTQGLNVSGIATQVLYGSCDGDVVDGAPIRVYERAAPPKQLLYIYGANHYGFTQDISVAPCDLSHTAQHSIAQSAITTFLAYALRGDVVAGEAVRGDRWPLPGLSNYLIYPTYQDPTRLDVDTFEDEPYSLSKNSLAEQNTLSGLTAIEASLDSLTEDCFPGGYECYECLCLIPHTTRGLHLAWSTGLTTTAVFTATLPPGLTLAPYTHLAFRAASRMRPLTAPLDTPQDIRVSLTDTDGHQATLTLSATGQLIPYPYHPPIIPFIPHRLQTILSVMRGVRLPLADFTRQTPTLRLDRLAAIGLQFPAAIGEVIVDDVGFTR